MSDTESDHDDDEHQIEVQNLKINEFVGITNNKQGWVNCMYCDRYHPPSMHLPGLEYCIHCWAWFNTNQLDLEKGTYTGLNSISDVKKYLKDTFKLHDPLKCTNVDCIYNKIIKFEKDKKLHVDFCAELGFVVEVKQNVSDQLNQLNSINSTNSTNLTTSTNLSDKTNSTTSTSLLDETNSRFKINHKKNARINYKLSYISI